MQIKAIIIDDERSGRETLQALIQDYCPSISIEGLADSANQARELIKKFTPDVVFLDIEMPKENGFDLLKSLPDKNFMVVFVTAYNQYALNAIKASALDYLLKPVDIDELKSTEEKLKNALGHNKKNPNDYKEVISAFLDNFSNTNKIQKLTLPHAKGYKIVNLKDIIRLEADSNYTLIYLIGGEKFIVSKTLKEFDDILDDNIFFRAHKSHIINMEHLKEYIQEGGYAKMADGSVIDISRRRAAEFSQKVSEFTISLKKNQN